MAVSKMIRWAVLSVGLVAAGAWALQDAPARGDREGKRFKVTPWPSDSGERNFHEQVEQHLNEMAAQGWEYHSALMGQPAKVMVFRRP